MLTRRPHRSQSLLCLLAAGCAVVPPATWPEHTDADLAVRCRVPESGRLRVPATAPDLVVRTLVAEPAPRGERFAADGARFLLYDAGTEVVVRTNVRLYGGGDPRALFPEAVEWLSVQ